LPQDMNHPPRLEGGRIVLRPIDPRRDAPDMYEIFLDPEMHRWTGNHVPTDVREVESYLRHLSNVEEIFAWAVVLKETGRVIGTWWMAKPVRREGKRIVTAEAQRIGKRWWRSGVTADARNLVYHWAFLVLGVDEIHAQCWEGNDASRRSMERAGFRLLRRVNKWFEKEGRECAELHFVLTREDWLRFIPE
jgi:ribosomal-protein-alanine N-acetyltransferase